LTLLVLQRPRRCARAAVSTELVLSPVGIIRVEQVSIFAMSFMRADRSDGLVHSRLGGIFRIGCLTTLHVFPAGHRLKVLGIHASPIPAQMINM